MQLTDLGPLERSVLMAVLHAELAGAAVPAAFIWRTLPGYETHLANVEAALAEGLPLRGWLTERGGLFCARDRAELPRGVSAARRRGEARWEEVRSLVVGLGKLPWVEAVAVVGPMAWGLLPSICDPCPVAIIAEGGRVDLARAAAGARLRAAGEAGDSVELAHTFDGDEQGHPELEIAAGLVLATLRPVTNLEAWLTFADANPWLARRFPNARPDAPELPDYLAGGRVDGKLAALRRRLVSRRSEGPVLGSSGRRRGPWGPIERALDRALEPGTELGVEALLGADFGRRFDRRWAELASWVMPDEPGSEPEPPEERIEAADGGAVESDARAAVEEAGWLVLPKPVAHDLSERTPEVEAASQGARPSQVELPLAASSPEEVARAPAEVVIPSRRRRGASRRPARQTRSAASGQSGQRLAGAGRKRRS